MFRLYSNSDLFLDKKTKKDLSSFHWEKLQLNKSQTDQTCKTCWSSSSLKIVPSTWSNFRASQLNSGMRYLVWMGFFCLSVGEIKKMFRCSVFKPVVLLREGFNNREKNLSNLSNVSTGTTWLLSGAQPLCCILSTFSGHFKVTKTSKASRVTNLKLRVCWTIFLMWTWCQG